MSRQHKGLILEGMRKIPNNLNFHYSYEEHIVCDQTFNFALFYDSSDVMPFYRYEPIGYSYSSGMLLGFLLVLGFGYKPREIMK